MPCACRCGAARRRCRSRRPARPGSAPIFFQFLAPCCCTRRRSRSSCRGRQRAALGCHPGRRRPTRPRSRRRRRCRRQLLPVRQIAGPRHAPPAWSSLPCRSAALWSAPGCSRGRDGAGLSAGRGAAASAMALIAASSHRDCSQLTHPGAGRPRHSLGPRCRLGAAPGAPGCWAPTACGYRCSLPLWKHRAIGSWRNRGAASSCSCDGGGSARSAASQLTAAHCPLAATRPAGAGHAGLLAITFNSVLHMEVCPCCAP